MVSTFSFENARNAIEDYVYVNTRDMCRYELNEANNERMARSERREYSTKWQDDFTYETCGRTNASTMEPPFAFNIPIATELNSEQPNRRTLQTIHVATGKPTQRKMLLCECVETAAEGGSSPFVSFRSKTSTTKERSRSLSFKKKGGNQFC